MHRNYFHNLAACMLLAAVLPSAQASIHFLIPGAAGGGWDRTARATGEALTQAGLISTATFENMSGGGGGKAIAHLIERAQADTLMVNSTPIVVRALQGVFPQNFRDLTPVASIIGDYSVVVVRAASATNSLAQLAEQMRANPRSVAIAGGSVAGGTDHIFAAMTFSAMGVPVRQLKYIPYDAGGKAMGGLLSGEVQALSSGYGEVVDLLDQGYVRLLCVAARQRLAFIASTPTCSEAGASDAYFVNWRGFFAAPSTPPERIAHYQTMLAELQTTSAWAQMRQRYGWVDLYTSGDDFVALLNEQEQRLGQLLTELGLL